MTANANGLDLRLVSGLVLAGGKSSRMQQLIRTITTEDQKHQYLHEQSESKHIEKGLLLLHQKPMVQWVLESFPKSLQQHYISANRCLKQYSKFATVVTDNSKYEGYSGPLAGIASALQVIKTPWLLVAPTDVPMPPKGVFQNLLNCAAKSISNGGNNKFLFYTNTANGLQPLFCLMHKNILPSLQKALHAKQYRVRIWLQSYGFECMFDAGETDFFNINNPNDLLLAHNIIASGKDTNQQ